MAALRQIEWIIIYVHLAARLSGYINWNICAIEAWVRQPNRVNGYRDVLIFNITKGGKVRRLRIVAIYPPDGLADYPLNDMVKLAKFSETAWHHIHGCQAGR